MALAHGRVPHADTRLVWAVRPHTATRHAVRRYVRVQAPCRPVRVRACRAMRSGARAPGARDLVPALATNAVARHGGARERSAAAAAAATTAAAAATAAATTLEGRPPL